MVWNKYKLFFQKQNIMGQQEKQNLILKHFYGIFMKLKKKDLAMQLEIWSEKKLIIKDKEYLQSITIKGHKIATIDRHKVFYTPPNIIRRRWGNILRFCRYLGKYILSDDDKKQLRALYPGFGFNELAEFVRLISPDLDEFGPGDVVLMKSTEYNKIPYVEMNVFNFFISNPEYKKCLNTPFGILCHPVLKDIPEPILEFSQLKTLAI